MLVFLTVALFSIKVLKEKVCESKDASRFPFIKTVPGEGDSLRSNTSFTFCYMTS